LLPLNPDAGHPTCNIVVQKEGEEEKVCGRLATQMVTIVNPDEPSQVLAVVLVCDEHDHALEEGRGLIAVSENGQERMGVQYKIDREGEKEDHDANANEAPDGA
jgi:hypothetical protein